MILLGLGGSAVFAKNRWWAAAPAATAPNQAPEAAESLGEGTDDVSGDESDESDEDEATTVAAGKNGAPQPRPPEPDAASASTQANAIVPSNPGSNPAPNSEGATTLDAELSVRRRERAVAQERVRVDITMYANKWCPVCTKARAFLASQNIRYIERDTEQNAAAVSILKRLNPRGTVPTFDIDGEVLVGFGGGESLLRAIDRAAAKRANTM